jgi:hypothetical protein
MVPYNQQASRCNIHFALSRVDNADCDDARDLAARLIAVRFGLAPHLAVLIVSLAGIAGGRQ